VQITFNGTYVARIRPNSEKKNLQIKGKADDLYRGSMQFENHRMNRSTIPPLSVLGQIPRVKYLNTFKYFQILNLVQVPGTYFSRSFRTNNRSVLQHQSHNRIKTAPIDTIIVSIPKEWPDFINF